MYSHFGFSLSEPEGFALNGIDGAWVDEITKSHWRAEWTQELDRQLSRLFLNGGLHAQDDPCLHGQ